MSKNVPSDNQSPEESVNIEDLVKKNLELTNEIHNIAVYVKKYIFWQKIFGFLKIFIFIIPLILGIMYLPPLLSQVLEQYEAIVNMGSKVNNMPNIENISPDILKFLKK